MITRRRLSLATGGLLLPSAPRIGLAQARTTMRRVGITAISPPGPNPRIDAFKQSMADLGWQEGRNVQYRVAHANGDVNRFDAVASELLAQGAEVIVTVTNASTRAVQKLAPSLPIVMASNGNVVESGLVASLARPGGSTTGLTMQYEDLRDKLIEVLHEMVPQALRIAVLYSSPENAGWSDWPQMQRACAALGLQALRFDITDPSQIAAVIEQIERQQSHAVLPLGSMLFVERQRLAALLKTARLPSAYFTRDQVLAGGLFSYGASLVAIYRSAARYVDKILRGAKPGDLPVEQPTIFELVINMATARALGITVPRALLLRADELIQ